MGRTCLKSVVQSQSARHMLLLYSITFLVILPLVCSNLQFSFFNFTNMDSQIGRDKLMKQNELRLIEAHQTRGLLQKTNMLDKMKNMTSPDMAITIVTTARNHFGMETYKPFYLTQVVWKMLWLIYKVEQNKIFNLKVSMSVCNVDSHPEIHQEAIGLTSLLHVISKYKHDDRHKTWNIFEKEKRDYVYCLNSTLEHNPKFVLVVEDDSLPDDDLFVVLETIIKSHSPFHTQHYDLSSQQGKHYKVHDSTYIKLFHPERLLGYISLEPDRLSELFGISVVLGTALLFVYIYIFKLKLETFQHIYKVWFALALYVALVVMAIGRPHLLNMRRLLSPHLYSFMSAPDCCTPAMLFPFHGAQEVVEYLNGQSCYANNAKDTVLDRYIQMNHKTAFIVQPNLFQHIGFYSSLRHKFLNPYVV